VLDSVNLGRPLKDRLTPNFPLVAAAVAKSIDAFVSVDLYCFI
jgi:hypothetical protein